MSKIFFIIGAGRSGTTAMVEALNSAKNVVVHSEESPQLCVGARMQYEGSLPYPKEFIYKSKQVRIEEAMKQGKIYGDKNPNYLYFVKEMSEVWDCKFLFLIRDGRDVVRSCMDFHAVRGPGYDRYEDDEVSLLTQPEDNYWDFARLRPHKTAREYRFWRQMEKFEKFAWQWSEFNRILLDKTRFLTQDRYRLINMTKLKPKSVEKIFDFLNLNSFDLDRVNDILNSNINTVDMENAESFPSWKDWSDDLVQKFDRYAEKMMMKLGYYSELANGEIKWSY